MKYHLLTFDWHFYVGHEEPWLVSFSEVMNNNIIFVLLLEHRATDASCVFPDHLSKSICDQYIDFFPEHLYLLEIMEHAAQFAKILEMP